MVDIVHRSFDRASGKSALHMVSAWGCEQRPVAAQIAADAKSHEITAVPKLLDMLSLKGTIMTAAALDCQCAIAPQIVEQSGEYTSALKANQSAMHDDLKLFFVDLECEATAGLPWRLSAESSGTAKPLARPPPRQPITCSSERLNAIVRRN